MSRFYCGVHGRHSFPSLGLGSLSHPHCPCMIINSIQEYPNLDDQLFGQFRDMFKPVCSVLLPTLSLWLGNSR